MWDDYHLVASVSEFNRYRCRMRRTVLSESGRGTSFRDGGAPLGSSESRYMRRIESRG